MTTLYALPESWRFILICLAIIAVIGRALCYKLASFFDERGNLALRPSTLQLLLLIWTFIQSFLIVKAQLNVRDSVLTPMQWPVIRTSLAIAITLIILADTRRQKRLKQLVIVPFIALTLPQLEQSNSGCFAVCYALSLVFLLLNSYYIYRLYNRRLASEPSRLTVKEAIDSLDSGVLFAKQNGEIILINQAMQRQLLAALGKVYWPAEVIDFSAIPFDQSGRYRYVTSVQTTAFQHTNLPLGEAEYQQLTATDISEQWRMTEALAVKKRELEAAIATLTNSIDNIMTICQESEYRQLEIAIHNQMSRSISLLLGALHQKKSIAKHDLLSFVDELSHGFTEHGQSRLTTITIADITANFKLLGVTINYNALPATSSKLYPVYGDIVREATSNAIRHGLASAITIDYARSEQGEKMTISNDGEVPNQPIRHGVGLTGMAAKLANLGAVMSIQTKPLFSIIIELKGASDD